jgi:flavin reductase (DIM6/NTAB) family NADH-FMN oxidoreductase RutF
MKTIDPAATPTPELYQYLVGVVGPRPIAFASTVDREGRPNLAPFSYFNIFSTNPPVLGFSAVRRGIDAAAKDTLRNVEETGEVVINMVSYGIVRQMAVASVQFPRGVDEFVKSGLTPLSSELVRPFRVKESPVHMECRVRQVIALGERSGAGNLIICDLLRLHVAEGIFDEQGRINPHRLDLMGRLGRAYYARASGEAVYKIFQDQTQPCLGYDQLPASARHSAILTGNNLGQLAGILAPPTPEAIRALRSQPRVAALLAAADPVEALHRYAQIELAKENTDLAAEVVWLTEEVARELA